jgi:hypothetical protein
VCPADGHGSRRTASTGPRARTMYGGDSRTHKSTHVATSLSSQRVRAEHLERSAASGQQHAACASRLARVDAARRAAPPRGCRSRGERTRSDGGKHAALEAKLKQWQN